MAILFSNFKRLICLVFIFLFNRLPIKKNKLFFYSYYGSQYGCNPKYITEYILKDDASDRYTIVWAFNDVKAKAHLGFKKVKTMSIKYFYHLCTSKVVITNFRTTDFFIKRKDQFYIQTWHSSLRLKQIEGDAESSLPDSYIKMAKSDSEKCDLLLSGCQFSTDIFRRAFWYDGPIFEHGTPRNDALFRNDPNQRESVRQAIGLENDTRVILYAPTFRKHADLSIYNLDYQKVMETAEKRFGGKWVALVKWHPHLISQANRFQYGSKVIDVTAYDDIQELLLVTDLLISDYSSLIFDFAITERPCFLYVPDLDEYVAHDRNLYFNLMELPFVSAKGMEELQEKMENFHSDEYLRHLKRFLEKIGSFEDGRACEYLLGRIEEICYGIKPGRVRHEAV